MPHLRALVERFEGRPFAVVGVNAFDTEEDYRQGLEDYKVSWISAFQGASPVISELYRVDGYPTYYLIDHEGKVAMRGYDDDAILRLVEAAEKAGE